MLKFWWKYLFFNLDWWIYFRNQSVCAWKRSDQLIFLKTSHILDKNNSAIFLVLDLNNLTRLLEHLGSNKNFRLSIYTWAKRDKLKFFNNFLAKINNNQS